MIGALWLLLVNFFRSIRNGLRGLRRGPLGFVVMELDGPLPEFSDDPPWWKRRFMNAQPHLSLSTLRTRFRRIAAEPRLQGVVLRVHHLHAGWATLQSLQQEMERLRAAGKRVVVHLATPDTTTYYALSSADTLLMPPSGMLLLTGFHREVFFLKEALERVGIAAEVTAVSPYKAAGETLVQTDFSPENRAQVQRLLDRRFEIVVETVARNRKRTADEVRTFINRAPFRAEDALAAGLIDGVAYEDELSARLGSGGTPAKLITWRQAQRRMKIPYTRRHRKLVGLVRVEGTITSGRSRALPVPVPMMGSNQAGAESIIQALRAAEASSHVAAVVVRVDSPGGDAYASDLIWREVARLREKKPVVVSMGDAAASGGYYLAAPAHSIIAQPGTLTGSIGVISVRPVAHALVEKLGIHARMLTHGLRAGMFSPLTPPTEEHRAGYRHVVQTSYAQFKERVRAGRNITEEALEPLAGGRVWLGEEALTHGLIDALGGLPEAVKKARELASLPPDETAPVLILKGKGQRQPPEAFPVKQALELMEEWPRMVAERPWAILPFTGL